MKKKKLKLSLGKEVISKFEANSVIGATGRLCGSDYGCFPISGAPCDLQDTIGCTNTCCHYSCSC